MRFPTVHDFIDFRYSRPAHVALLLVLLIVWLAQVVIAAVAGFKYYVAVYFAFGIVVPVLAVVLVYVRVLPFVEQFEWFPGDTVGVELVGYAIHMGLNAVAFSPLINELSSRPPNDTRCCLSRVQCSSICSRHCSCTNWWPLWCTCGAARRSRLKRLWLNSRAKDAEIVPVRASGRASPSS